MFDISLAQSQSVLPVDLYEHPILQQQLSPAGATIAIDPDIPFPPPQKFLLISATASLGTNGDVTLPPPQK